MARRVEVEVGNYMPALNAACFFFAAMARGWLLLSESESGSRVRCRLLGRGFEDWTVVVAAFLSHGSVLAMITGRRMTGEADSKEPLNTEKSRVRRKESG